MRIFFLTLLMAVMAVIMFQLGKHSQKNLNKTIVVTANEIKPSEGDLLRVQYVNGNEVYLCTID